jgi:hypothetical protein
MPVDLAQLVGGALGGAIASSVLGPWIAQGRDRRDLRANVLQQLALVEERRWASPTQPWDPFRDAAQALRAAALVSRAPRELVDLYLRLATVARVASERSLQEVPPHEGGGAINSDLNELVQDAAAYLTDHLWTPVRRRHTLSRNLAAIRTDEQALRDAERRGDYDSNDWDARVP